MPTTDVGLLFLDLFKPGFYKPLQLPVKKRQLQCYHKLFQVCHQLHVRHHQVQFLLVQLFANGFVLEEFYRG